MRYAVLLTGSCGLLLGCTYVPNPGLTSDDEAAVSDESTSDGAADETTAVTETSSTETSASCGNGFIDEGEECDGSELGDMSTCADVGLGTTDEALGCTPECTYDYAECTGCGDGIVTPPEDCEPASPRLPEGDLAGASCTSLGFDGGTLTCAADCSGFDVDACTDCGDGVVEGSEQCDGNNLDGQTCIQQGFLGGALSCTAECALNTSQCNASCAPDVYSKCDGTPGALTTDPWQAIGVGCPGNLTNAVVAANRTMNSNNANAWRVAAQFGSANGQNPNYAVGNYNGKMWAANPGTWTNPTNEVIASNTSTAILILSTGVVAAANAQSVVIENNPQTGNGDNGNVDAGGLPAPLSSLRGSNNGMRGTPFINCDQVHDCSDSLYMWWNVNNWNNPDDKLWMQADLTVPQGAEGFVFDFAFFSSEFPTYYDTQYNDQFIAWSTSEVYTGNLTFVNGAPLNLTSLEDAGAFAYKGNAPELAGTGFTGNAGTGWFVVRGPSVSEEVFQLTFFISDLADSVLATGVLLDNFRWECNGCIPSRVESCGIQAQ